MKTLFLSLAFILFGCSSFESSKPLIMTSIPPYVAIVKEIAGDAIDVKSFIQSDDNPHTFEPTARQMRAVERALVWIGIGEPFEKRVTSVMKKAHPKAEVLNLTQFVTLNQGDRHIWMSLRLMKKQIIPISEAIADLIPDQALKIKQNATALAKKLDQLDQQIFHKLSPFTGQALLVAHPSFGYFCNDYNLVQVPVEAENKSPLPAQLKVIFEMTKTTRFRCGFTVPQGHDKGTKQIAEKLKIPVYAFNPLAEDYFDNMSHLADLISK